MGLGGVAIAVPPYVIHPKTAVLGRAGGGSWRERHGIASVVKLFLIVFYYCEGASLTNGAPS